jgi:hypothetical protein
MEGLSEACADFLYFERCQRSAGSDEDEACADEDEACADEDEACADFLYFERCQRSAGSGEERSRNSKEFFKRNRSRAKSKAKNERRLN